MQPCGIIQKLREDYLQLNPENYNPVTTNLVQAMSLINLGNSELEMGFPVEEHYIKLNREVIAQLQRDLNRVSENYKRIVEDGNN